MKRFLLSACVVCSSILASCVVDDLTSADSTPAGGSSVPGGTTNQQHTQYPGSGSGSGDPCDPDNLDDFLHKCDNGSAGVDGPEVG